MAFPENIEFLVIISSGLWTDTITDIFNFLHKEITDWKDWKTSGDYSNTRVLRRSKI